MTYKPVRITIARAPVRRAPSRLPSIGRPFKPTISFDYASGRYVLFQRGVGQVGTFGTYSEAREASR